MLPTNYSYAQEITLTLCVKKKLSIEDYIDTAIQGLEEYIKKSKATLIATSSNSNSNIKTNSVTRKSRKQKWEEKQLYGSFKQQTST